MFFLRLDNFLINFWLIFCLWLTLFDMTIHLKTAIAVSEYMELIPGYLSLIQEFQGGKKGLPLLRYRLSILKSWNETLYTGRLGFRIFWSQKGEVWDLPQSVRRKPITMQGVRPRSQPSLVDKVSSSRSEKLKSRQSGTSLYGLTRHILYKETASKFISLRVPFHFPSKSSHSSEGLTLEGP